MKKPISERLQKYTICQITGCWIWIGSKDKDGYGRICGRTNYKHWNMKAHRVSYEYFIGQINGLQVLHKCDNPSCINPNHLFLGTQQENIADMMRKGRHVARPLYGSAWHEARDK